MSRETEFSEHAKDMLIERKIPDEWVWRAISSPDNKETGVDGNTHYIKAIEEHGYRILRVVVNSDVKPNRVITVFFDRRLKRKK
jgi:hypothetical protein